MTFAGLSVSDKIDRDVVMNDKGCWVGHSAFVVV